MISGARSPVPRRRWLPMTVLFGVAGVAHFARPAGFDAIVPRSLPGPPRAWTQASGVAELGLAAGFALPATRRASALAAAGFLLAVWPANGRMALDAWHRRGRDRAHAVRCGVALVRLPLQLPLVRAALRAGGVR